MTPLTVPSRRASTARTAEALERPDPTGGSDPAPGSDPTARADPTAPAVAGLRGPGSRVLGRSLWALAVLALVATGLLGWFRVWPQHQLAAGRESDAAAVAAGRAMAVNFTTLDYTRFAAYRQQVLDGAAGDFAAQWQQQSTQLQTLVTQNRSTSTPTRTEVALVSADSDSAEVIAGIVARTTNTAAPDGVTKTYRMDLKLVKVSGAWKVNSLEYVS